YDFRNLFLDGGFVRRKSAGRLAAVFLLAALVRPETARASLPRLVVGDLHGEADLKEIGVATQILVGAALERSGAVEVVPRPEVIAAFQGIGAPARDGLWLGPTEARAICEATQCTQLLVGTVHRDAALMYVSLRLLQHDGSVAKTARLTQPLRQLSL